MIITYIVIGIIVQVCVLIERQIRCRDEIDVAFDCLESIVDIVLVWIGVVLLSGFNALIWPVTIVSEITNIINDR